MRVSVLCVLVALVATVFADSCSQFVSTTYGAPRPAVTAAKTGAGEITITVQMFKQTSGNTGALLVYHDVDVASTQSNVCQNSDNLAHTSAGKSWVTVGVSNGCTTTYTLTQTVSDILTSRSDNKWTTTLINSGTTIQYETKIFTTYSVVKGANCYYVGFVNTVRFQTQLSLASTSTLFVTADNSASFAFTGLRVTTDNKFEIAGKITPLVPDSQLVGIYMKRDANDYTINPSAGQDTCTTYNVACNQLYSTAITTALSTTSDVGGSYTIHMDVQEGGAGNWATTRPDETITFQIDYIMPTDPQVVSSDVIETEQTLYTTSSYGTERTASYNTANEFLYIKNSVKATSPSFPANYVLTFTDGYMCCVPYMNGVIPPYTAANGGGCYTPNGVFVQRKTFLVGGNIDTDGGIMVAPDTTRSYKVAVELNKAMTGPAPRSTMTCQVLLFSKLVNPSVPAGRSLNGAEAVMVASNLNQTFVSTISYTVTPQGVVTVSSATNAFISVAAVAIVLVNLLL